MRSFAWLAALLVVSVGCSDYHVDLVNVTGSVTMDGHPLADATVRFLPIVKGNEPARPSSAVTNGAGQFVLGYSTTRQGALPGNYKVYISTYREPQPGLPGIQEMVPVVYNKETKLTEVVAGPNQQFAFNLKSDAGRIDRPNIVMFLADDLGWGDLGCYGHDRVQSPNLDRFAAEGVRLTQCYAACALCSPSRSAILTGRTPYRNGVYRWIPNVPRNGSHVHLRDSEITIAELLKAQGYETCHVGKWHLNGDFNSPHQPQPDDQGYDYWFATQNNANPTHKNPINFVRNGTPVGPLTGYSASLVADEAIGWLEELRSPDAPFFLEVWTHETHPKIETDPQYQKPYADLPVGLRQHHGNVTQMDAAFGKLMQALDDQGLAENTLVIFTSDNGPEGDGNGTPDDPGSWRDRDRGSTGGLRGRKRDDFEGGIRVPGIVRWPGRIEPGTVSDVPVIGSDVLPTICEVVGIPLPDDRVIDGASMVPAFADEPIQRDEPLYWRTHISAKECRIAVRVGDWKIVADDTRTHFLLFNMKDDPEEAVDRSADRPEVFARMKELLLTMDDEVLSDGPDWWKDDKQSGVGHLSEPPG